MQRPAAQPSARRGRPAQRDHDDAGLQDHGGRGRAAGPARQQAEAGRGH